MNDWQKEAQEKQNQLNALAHLIAQHLGEWKQHEDELHHTSGAKLYLSYCDNGHDRSRLAIRGGLHIGRNGAYETVYDPTTHERLSPPFITVAIARGVETIAKEIRRRVIPEYLRIFKLAVMQVQRQHIRMTTTQENLKRLAAITRDTIDFASQPERKEYSFYETNSVSGEVYVSENRVDLKRISNLTMEQAEFILRYLYDQHDRKTKQEETNQ